MDQPEAPIFLMLDKSYFFVYLPEDPPNQSGRYLQCPATGHVYCTSTGSLYRRIQIIPLSDSISSLLQGRGPCLLPSLLPSKSKATTPTQADPPVPGAKSSPAFIQGNSDSTTNKKKKARSKRAKKKKEKQNQSAGSEKKPASSKQKKPTVVLKLKPTTPYVKNYLRFENTALSSQTPKKGEDVCHRVYNPSPENKRKSFVYVQFYLHYGIKSVRPMQAHFQDILCPTPDPPKLSSKQAKRKTEIIPVSSSRKKWPPRYKKKLKPTLYFSRYDLVMMYLECNFDDDFTRKTVKKKKIMCQRLVHTNIFED
ncbi:uncharacterized protein [Dendropsophus ebraccatus]|uniref:uncharacterized protein n=1 Tax=Dendropsophus ebraccatus TaxID=150705 RepID=UPI003831C61F